MRLDQLPSPGIYGGGQRLRVEIANAISAVQIADAANGGRGVLYAENLKALFDFASAALADYIREPEEPEE